MKNTRQLQRLFERYLMDNSFDQEPSELYQPVNYILGMGGKRLRPVLLLMSYQLFSDNVDKALPAAMAVEVFHNFSLVHDDIMDEAPLRRGQPSVHKKYDQNTGILSGDVMLIYTYEFLLRLKTQERLPELLRVFNQLAIDVCEGQQYDMNFESRTDVRIGEYLKMIELKTAALIRGCLELGALIAGASSQDIFHLAEFGRNIGIAFQLQDDILDTFGMPEKFGKKPGGDIVQNKKTFLILKALELADEKTATHLKKLMHGHGADEEGKISQVKEIFQQLNIKEQAEQQMQKFQTTAFNHLDAVSVSDERKKTISDLTDELTVREY